MALDKITKISGTTVTVPGDDIDTDRIIPARYMKCVTFDGLGQYLFQDIRFDEQGNKRGHALDSEEHKGATILISGNNFGCGSSREHAPQAIKKFGLRAVIALGYAEIFFGNSTTLGIPCVILNKADHARLTEAVAKDTSLEVTIDLLTEKVTFGGEEVPFTMLKGGALKALVAGTWDPIGELLGARDKVSEVEASLGYLA